MNDEIDWNRVDDAALALLYLTLHDGGRVWKQIAWSVTDRLYDQDLILDPRNKARSLVLTDAGLERAEAAFKAMFIDQPSSR